MCQGYNSWQQTAPAPGSSLTWEAGTAGLQIDQKQNGNRRMVLSILNQLLCLSFTHFSVSPPHSNQDHKTLVLSLPAVSILGKNGTQTGCAIICLESHSLEYRIQIQSPYFLISFTACNNLRLTVRYILAKLLMMDRCIMSEPPMPILHQLAITRKG